MDLTELKRQRLAIQKEIAEWKKEVVFTKKERDDIFADLEKICEESAAMADSLFKEEE